MHAINIQKIFTYTYAHHTNSLYHSYLHNETLTSNHLHLFTTYITHYYTDYYHEIMLYNTLSKTIKYCTKKSLKNILLSNNQKKNQ